MCCAMQMEAHPHAYINNSLYVFIWRRCLYIEIHVDNFVQNKQLIRAPRTKFGTLIDFVLFLHSKILSDRAVAIAKSSDVDEIWFKGQMICGIQIFSFRVWSYRWDWFVSPSWFFRS